MASLRTFSRGEKVLELTYHLGNVLATISGKKIAVPSPSNSSLIDHYEADVVSAQDYYPGGMQMPGRSYTSGNEYRYGFNGKEKDDKDGVVQYDYGFRIYDPRIVRFKSVDPLTRSYASLTPYQYASNSPIWGVDLDGLEMLKSNSSIYLVRYKGYTLFNTVHDDYVVETVYDNIPNVLKDPNTRDLKSTMGGPVTAYGRDWDVQKDGVTIYSPSRYYNSGPSFFGVADDAKSPSQTNSTRGLYSFSPDAPNDKATDANENARKSVASRADWLKHGVGIFRNIMNQDIWGANATEGENRFLFYRSTNLVDKYMGEGRIGDKSIVNGQGRADLINFVTDGTLPMGGKAVESLSKADLEYNLRIMYTGVQLLYRDNERGNINQQTSETFKRLNDAYQQQGGSVNFSKLYEIQRPN